MELVHRRVVTFILLVVTLLSSAGLVNATELRILAPNAVKETITEIATRYEKATGFRVVISWAGTEAITKQISDGNIFDVVVNASQNIDKLEKEGKLSPGSRADFAKSAIGVALRVGIPRADISSIDALKHLILQAKLIAISSGTSGRYLADLFQQLGIVEQIKDRIKQPPSGAQIGEMLARGEVDLGFQQTSELIHVKGIVYLGPLPTEIQSITVYSAGVHSAASAPTAAMTFLKMLTAPDFGEFIRKTGMEPA
jgi:molybdate transport system substrate-binding protein